MFCPLDYEQTAKVFRGVLGLFLVIILGVYIAEGQLNGLTQRQECAYAFNVNCDSEGRYAIYLLGASYRVNAVYLVGEFINNKEEIIIKTSYSNINIPKYIEFDCKKELVLLEIWANLLMEECSKYKQSLD